MKDIQIKEYCDYCWADNERRTVATCSWHIALDDAARTRMPGLRELATCDKHAKALRVLHSLVRDHLVPAEIEPPSVMPKAAVEQACPICEQKLANPVPHVWNVHVKGRPSRPAVCPECDWKPSPDVLPGKAPASVGRHRATMHGYDPLAEGVAEYRRQEGRREQLPL